MAKTTVESLKKQKNLDKKIDTLADIMVQGFDDVRNELRTEFKSEIGSLKSEFKSDISSLRTELKTEIQRVETSLKREISSVRADIIGIKQDIAGIKTRLEYVYEKAMQSDDILVEDVVELQNHVKKLQKQVAYLEAKTK